MKLQFTWQLPFHASGSVTSGKMPEVHQRPGSVIVFSIWLELWLLVRKVSLNEHMEQSLRMLVLSAGGWL